MKASKKTIALTIVAILVIAAFIAVVYRPWELLSAHQTGATQNTQGIEDRLGVQQHNITNLLLVANNNFDESFSLTLHYSCTGEPFYIAVPDEETDAIVDKLVDAYNADPSTTDSVETSYIKDCLTEDIAALSYPVDWDSSFVHFLQWCHKPADIVSKSSGEYKNPGDAVSNYNYIKSMDEFVNCEYRWQYTPDTASQSKDS